MIEVSEDDNFALGFDSPNKEKYMNYALKMWRSHSI